MRPNEDVGRKQATSNLPLLFSFSLPLIILLPNNKSQVYSGEGYRLGNQKSSSWNWNLVLFSFSTALLRREWIAGRLAQQEGTVLLSCWRMATTGGSFLEVTSSLTKETHSPHRCLQNVLREYDIHGICFSYFLRFTLLKNSRNIVRKNNLHISI